MEILKEIGTFIWAVLSIWQAYMTGGIVIALVGIYERVTQKTISLRGFIVGVVAFLLVAFFLAWREERRGRFKVEKELIARSKPCLVSQIEQTIISDGPNPNSTLITIILTVTDTGAPSIVQGWKLHVTQSNGSELEAGKIVTWADIIQYPYTEGVLSLHKEDFLPMKAVEQPIPTNGRVTGFLLFELGVKREQIGPEGAHLKLSFYDALQQLYTVTQKFVYSDKQPLFFPGMRMPEPPNRQKS